MSERGGRPSRAEPLPPLSSSSRRGTQIRLERRVGKEGGENSPEFADDDGGDGEGEEGTN
jgi:hypothetical protein